MLAALSYLYRQFIYTLDRWYWHGLATACLGMYQEIDGTSEKEVETRESIPQDEPIQRYEIENFLCFGRKSVSITQSIIYQSTAA